jgi:SAM-dependent methyltransferase
MSAAHRHEEQQMNTDSLSRPEFPRSARYDAGWMMDGQMGPNAVWLTEWLCQELSLEPGMRVLDLGCGRALSSVFLAREFDLRVFAADLWIDPDHNWARIKQAGEEARVFPLRAEAHALPFAAGFFDAVISVDAYQYFGTDQLYLDYLCSFLRPGGQLGVVVPALTRELDGDPPAHLTRPQANGKVFWEDECCCFLTAERWRRLWQRCGKVTDVRTALLEDGWRHWAEFERALEAAGKSVFPSDAEALEQDAGQTIGFARAVARRSEVEAVNLYQANLAAKFGVE